MAGGRWRIASGIVLVPVAVAGAAGCSGGGGQSGAATASASAAVAKADGGLSAAELRGALLTRINGVAAAAPASSGSYSSLTSGASKTTGDTQITPKSCTGAAASGFNPAALAGSPAAMVMFKVGTNAVSEVLVASSAETSATALAGQVPANCSTFEEKVSGKTYKYGVSEKAVTGVGTQAKALSVQTDGNSAADLWSLIYSGKGFVGTVTVVGPNASEKAVRELGLVSYAYAAKALA